MTVRMMTLLLALGFAVGLVASISAAHAQLGNRPFQFSGGDGTTGMSDAGRQAIMRKKLFDETPDNLVRSPDGRLLKLEKGPGDSVIVSTRDGETIPGFRGRSIFRRSVGEGAGIFNAFFGTGRSSATQGGAFFIGGFGTRLSIANWTDMIADGGPTGAVPSRPNPIDGWTTQVFIYFAR